MNNKKGLGRGLGALLSIFDDAEEAPVQNQQQVNQESQHAQQSQPTPVFSAPATQEVPPVQAQTPPPPAPQQQFTAPQNPYASQSYGQAPQVTPVNPYGVPPVYAQPAPPYQAQEFSEDAFKMCVNEVPIELLEVNPNQPRKYFNEVSLAELAESIKIHGIIQPIVVNKIYANKYMIIAGERRYRAAKLIGLRTVPCVLKDYTERQVKEIALIENLQREDLNPIEAARAIKQLMEEYNFTQEVVADRIGKARPTVTNLLRLLNLTPEVIAMVEQGQLSAGHAKNLVSVADKNLQIKLANTIISKKLSVREVEKLVREVLRPKSAKPDKKIEQSPELINFTEELQRVFSTRVSIQGNDNRGRISIDYFSKDDLDRIYELVELLKNKKLTLEDLSNFNKRNNEN